MLRLVVVLRFSGHVIISNSNSHIDISRQCCVLFCDRRSTVPVTNKMQVRHIYSKLFYQLCMFRNYIDYVDCQCFNLSQNTFLATLRGWPYRFPSSLTRQRAHEIETTLTNNTGGWLTSSHGGYQSVSPR